jgi:hypothetical protein
MPASLFIHRPTHVGCPEICHPGEGRGGRLNIAVLESKARYAGNYGPTQVYRSPADEDCLEEEEGKCKNSIQKRRCGGKGMTAALTVFNSKICDTGS